MIKSVPCSDLIVILLIIITKIPWEGNQSEMIYWFNSQDIFCHHIRHHHHWMMVAITVRPGASVAELLYLALTKCQYHAFSLKSFHLSYNYFITLSPYHPCVIIVIITKQWLAPKVSTDKRTQRRWNSDTRQPVGATNGVGGAVNPQPAGRCDQRQMGPEGKAGW